MFGFDSLPGPDFDVAQAVAGCDNMIPGRGPVLVSVEQRGRLSVEGDKDRWDECEDARRMRLTQRGQDRIRQTCFQCFRDDFPLRNNLLFKNALRKRSSSTSAMADAKLRPKLAAFPIPCP